MEYLVGFVALLFGAGILAVSGWGISILKARFALDPGGKLLKSLEVWEEHAAEWIIAKAIDAGKDLKIPETRWELVNEATEWVVTRTPMLMDFLGYDRKDVANDLETMILNFLQSKVYDPNSDD